MQIWMNEYAAENQREAVKQTLMDIVVLNATTRMDLGMPKHPNTPRLKVNGCGDGMVSTACAKDPNDSTWADQREPIPTPISKHSLVLAPTVETRSGSTGGKQGDLKG